MNYNYNNLYKTRDTRIAGGFLGPFVLGGLTGGLVAPLFYNNRPYYYYPNPYQYYYPYRPF